MPIILLVLAKKVGVIIFHTLKTTLDEVCWVTYLALCNLIYYLKYWMNIEQIKNLLNLSFWTLRIWLDIFLFLNSNIELSKFSLWSYFSISSGHERKGIINFQQLNRWKRRIILMSLAIATMLYVVMYKVKCEWWKNITNLANLKWPAVSRPIGGHNLHAWCLP